MITVATSTFCRPDLVQLLADALAVTLDEPYEFVVYVQPGGLRREWKNVHRIVEGTVFGANASDEVIHAVPAPFVYLHDDCIPVLPWTTAIFPHTHSRRREAPTVEYHARKYAFPMGRIPVVRVQCESDAPEQWGGTRDMRAIAASCGVESLADGVFLHLDKGTAFPLPTDYLAAEKRLLVEVIAERLGIPAPDPLTEDEIERIKKRPPKRMAVTEMAAAAESKMAAAAESKPLAKGVGYYLKQSLSLFRIAVKPDCPCLKYAEQMNEWGPDGCLERMEEILDHLQSAAETRKLPFSRAGAERLVRIAVWRARRTVP